MPIVIVDIVWIYLMNLRHCLYDVQQIYYLLYYTTDSHHLKFKK